MTRQCDHTCTPGQYEQSPHQVSTLAGVPHTRSHSAPTWVCPQPFSQLRTPQDQRGVVSCLESYSQHVTANACSQASAGPSKVGTGWAMGAQKQACPDPALAHPHPSSALARVPAQPLLLSEHITLLLRARSGERLAEARVCPQALSCVCMILRASKVLPGG